MTDEETRNDQPEEVAEEAAEEAVPAAADAGVEPEAAPDAEPVPEGAEPETAPDEAALPVVSAKKKRKRLPRSERRQRPKVRRERPKERKPIVRFPKPEQARGRRQERRGVVVSSTMDKTIVVQVELVKMHPRYKKVVRQARKFRAHDERNEAKVGDVVRIVETRPLSKTKHWRLAEIVEVAR